MFVVYLIAGLMEKVEFYKTPLRGLSIDNQEYRTEQMNGGRYLKLSSKVENGIEHLIISQVGNWSSFKTGTYKLIRTSEYRKGVYNTYRLISYHQDFRYSVKLEITYEKPSKELFYLHFPMQDRIVIYFYVKNESEKPKRVEFDRYFTDEESKRWEIEKMDWLWPKRN